VEQYAALPDPVIAILESIKAPQRLVAHLSLVHDVATTLVKEIKREYPNLQFDEHEVLFGAATHDIGKVLFPTELVGPGYTHEECGAEILKKFAVSDSLARFTRTHGLWKSNEATIEDLLVSLADKFGRENDKRILSRLSSIG